MLNFRGITAQTCDLEMLIDQISHKIETKRNTTEGQKGLSVQQLFKHVDGSYQIFEANTQSFFVSQSLRISFSRPRGDTEYLKEQ